MYLRTISLLISVPAVLALSLGPVSSGAMMVIQSTDAGGPAAKEDDILFIIRKPSTLLLLVAGLLGYGLLQMRM